jgi:pimeloyl-ACP methyl ester carboxylesterase
MRYRGVYIIGILTAAWLLQCCNPGANRPDDFQYDAKQYERVSLNYTVTGQGDTTLFFIHGWNLNLGYWDGIVDHLKPRYRIVAMDLAGHGNSGKDRISWTAESFARDIIGIIAKEKLSNVILVGHSLGGELALGVYELNPDGVIAIIGVDNFKDVSFGITPAFREEFKEYMAKFKRNYPEMADAFARENIRTTNREQINRIVKDYRDADPKIALAVFKNMVPRYESDKMLLKKLPFKLRIIASDYEPYNENALKQYCGAGYSIDWIREAGHFPMVEQPEQFANVMDKVLADIKSK